MKSKASKAKKGSAAGKPSAAVKPSEPLSDSKPSKASNASKTTQASKTIQATKAGKEGIGSTLIRKVIRATCCGEPGVIESETHLDVQGQDSVPRSSPEEPAADPQPELDEASSPSETKECPSEKAALPPSGKTSKRAAKRAAKAAAEKKQQERRAQKLREKLKKEEVKVARKEVKQEKKRAQWQKKMATKEARLAKIKKRAENDPPFPGGRGDSALDRSKTLTPEETGTEKTSGTSPVSVPVQPVDSPPSQQQPEGRGQSPPASGRYLPIGSPEHHLVSQILGLTGKHSRSSSSSSSSTTEHAVPDVEQPQCAADDVAGGMAYRSPSRRRSPVVLPSRRQSRSPSPARLVSPPSPAARGSPQAARIPHPPSGAPPTDYIPSLGRAPPARRFNKTGVLDNIPSTTEKSRFSRYAGRDVNANYAPRTDPLRNLYTKSTAAGSKLQQQSRQQPLRAVHPQTETASKETCRHYSNHRLQGEEEDLPNGIANLQIDDTSSGGSQSSLSSKMSSRRDSYLAFRTSKAGSSDLKCPPIAGASPPEGASKSKMTRHGSGYQTEYKPLFANNLVNQQPASIATVPSRTKANSQLQDNSKSDGDKEKTKEAKAASQPAKATFTSAQHSVLGTGRTGNYQDGVDLSGKLGLNNLGSTCYMNAILQCLSQNKSIKEYFLSNQHLEDLKRSFPRDTTLVRNFADMIKQLWSTKKRLSCSPAALLKAFQRIAEQFDSAKQQDAQEFMYFFLCALHEQLNIAPRKQPNEPDIPDDISDDEKAQMAWDRYCARNDSIFSRLFVGQLKSTLECQTCGNRSVTFDIFWDLSVPVPERASPFQRRTSWERSSSQPAKDSYDIKDCLNKFTEAEVLDGDNMVTCNRCNKKRVFTKRFSIQRFPKHLVLHLKRFTVLRSKLTTYVEFPLEGLDMTQYHTGNTAPTSVYNMTNVVNHIARQSQAMYYHLWDLYDVPPIYDVSTFLDSPGSPSSQEAQYDLAGVSQHSGSMIGGHYIAYAKHLDTHKWFCYDDSRVDAIPGTSVPNSYAYILFYEQVDQN